MRISKFDLTEQINYKLSIPKQTIKLVMDAYTEYCNAVLNTGQAVNLFNLAFIKPVDAVYSRFKPTQAYIASLISISTKVSYETCNGVLRAVSEILRENLRNGYVTGIYGLIQLTPVFDVNGNYKTVRALTSGGIKQKVRSKVNKNYLERRRVQQ